MYHPYQNGYPDSYIQQTDLEEMSVSGNQTEILEEKNYHPVEDTLY